VDSRARSSGSTSLAVIQTHPVQYYTPIYRALEQDLGVPTTVIYGSDAGARGYRDREFGRQVQWDTDLLSGYHSVVLGHGPPEQASTRGLAAALARLRPAAVLLSGYSPRFYALAAGVALRSGQPLLLRAETTDASHPRGWLKANLRDGVLRRLYRRMRYCLYVGANARDHFCRLGVPTERLVFSPMSVPSRQHLQGDAAARARRRVRRQLGVSSQQQLVLFSGKLSRKKSPDHLLQAAMALPEALRARLVLAFMGDGPLRQGLAQQAAAPGAPPLHLLGFKNQSQLSAFYHAADLLVLPSLYQETWGLVVNEALMHGCPVLVSDRVGCHRDLVAPGVTGHVFAHGEVSELARQLPAALALAADPATAQRCRDAVAAYSTLASARGVAAALASLKKHG
jgi:glycosyltransferase involved in cell wall biosynthesis